MGQNDWITTQEAADRLGVSSARIRQMVAEKQVAARKMGSKYRGQWQVSLSEIEKLVQKKGVTQAMHVKNCMTPSPIVATLSTNYNEALRLMRQNDIKHLPIVDSKGRPLGIVTKSDMLRAEPSPVTSLSVFEIASFLDKVTMDKIMTSPVLAVDESCTITNAANFMLTNKIDSLLVMRAETLVGIITIADIFRNFIQITGGGQPGSIIEARIPNQKGHLAPFTQALSNAGSFIVSLAITDNKGSDYGYIDVKERGGSEQEIRKELDKLGYVEIISFRQDDSDHVLSFGLPKTVKRTSVK